MNYSDRQAEVNFFGGLLSDLNDIDDGKQVSSKQADPSVVTETRDLLHALSDVGLQYGSLTNPIAEAQLQHREMVDSGAIPDNGYDYVMENKLSQIYGINPDEQDIPYSTPTVTMSPVQSYSQPRVSTAWSLVTETVKGTKSTKVYSIKSNHSNQVIMDGMMMFEAAQTLVNLLNEGRKLTDVKILGIISAGLQYTHVMTEYIDAARKRQKVLNESRYDEAKELDGEITALKENAQKLKQRVMKFLVDEGYITK